MILGHPARGTDTNRTCPDCGSQRVIRHGDTRIGNASIKYVTEERFHCDECSHHWAVEYELGEVSV